MVKVNFGQEEDFSGERRNIPAEIQGMNRSQIGEVKG